jgi:hypothetical protein
MTVEAVWESFLRQLNSELAHMEDQRAVLQRERTSLLQRDLQGILDCIQEKETLQTQWRILEESRGLLKPGMAEFSGTHEDEVSLHRIVDLLEEPRRSRLDDLRRQYEDLVSQIQELTEGNRYLIQSALSHITRSIVFLRQFQDGHSSTYDGTGRIVAEGSGTRQVKQQA